MARVMFADKADMNNLAFEAQVWSIFGNTDTTVLDMFTLTPPRREVTLFGDMSWDADDILRGFVSAMSIDTDDGGFGFNIYITDINATLTTADNYNPDADQPVTLLSKFLAGGDTFTGSVGADVMNGFAGNDTFFFSGGADTFNGGSDNDTVSYAGASAGLFAGLEDEGSNSGEAAGDTFEGVENLIGTAFADTFYGDALNNRFVGGNGNDKFVGKGGSDTFDGGQGLDTVAYDASSSAGIRADLLNRANNTNEAAGDVYIGIENLDGSSFNDTLYGDNAANVLQGNSYHVAFDIDQDKLYGRGGNDVLKGWAGNDLLDGGTGKDTVTGGVGLDKFYMTTAADTSTNCDTITDFNVTDDTIYLSRTIFTAIAQSTNTTLQLKFYWESTTGTAHDADDRIVYETDTGILRYDSNGSLAGGNIQQIAVLSNKAAIGTALSNLDFFII